MHLAVYCIADVMKERRKKKDEAEDVCVCA